MRYTVRVSYVDVVGYIWMPHVVCSMRYTLDGYALRNLTPDDDVITREAVDQWLATNAGDFSQVIDFHASIEQGGETIDIPFATEDGENQYYDTLGGDD